MTTIKIRSAEYEPQLFTESDLIILTQIADQSALIDRYQQWQNVASSVLMKVFPDLPVELVAPGKVNLYLTEVLAISVQLQSHLLSDPAYLATVNDFQRLPISTEARAQFRDAVSALQMGQATPEPLPVPSTDSTLLQQIEALIDRKLQAQDRAKPAGFVPTI